MSDPARQIRLRRLWLDGLISTVDDRLVYQLEVMLRDALRRRTSRITWRRDWIEDPKRPATIRPDYQPEGA